MGIEDTFYVVSDSLNSVESSWVWTRYEDAEEYAAPIPSAVVYAVQGTIELDWTTVEEVKR